MSERGTMVDVAGWIILAGTFLLPLVSRVSQRDRRLAYVVWMGVGMHQAWAMTLSYITGLSSDAGDMHREAVASAGRGVDFIVGDRLYVQLMGSVYDVLAPSSFLGQQLSILAYTLACLAFVHVLDELEVKDNQWLLLALFALPLSMLRYTSTMIREAYQILFFALAVLWAIRFKTGGNPAALVTSALAAFAMGAFHHGLMVYAGAFSLLSLVWPVPRSSGGAPARVVMAGLTLAILGIVAFTAYGIVTSAGGGVALDALITNRALEYASQFRVGAQAIDARTTYDVRIDVSSPGALLLSLGPVFFYYMFSPFPWQVRAPSDLYGLLEAVLRALLLLAALREWRSAHGQRRSVFGMLILAYLGLAGLWALGTVNYGTAIRHHTTTTWILIAVGGPRLIRWVAPVVRAFFSRPNTLRASA